MDETSVHLIEAEAPVKVSSDSLRPEDIDRVLSLAESIHKNITFKRAIVYGNILTLAVFLFIFIGIGFLIVTIASFYGDGYLPVVALLLFVVSVVLSFVVAFFLRKTYESKNIVKSEAEAMNRLIVMASDLIPMIGGKASEIERLTYELRLARLSFAPEGKGPSRNP